METKKTVFETLSAINVNAHTEQKMGLTYLSWAWAWAEVKNIYPKAHFDVIENQNGWNYHTDGKSCWVKVQVTVEDEVVTETLPIMNYKNQSILISQVTSMDVNKAIKRCLVKALALLGLGLYIYAGEDLPEIADAVEDNKALAQEQKEYEEKSMPSNAKTTATNTTNRVYQGSLQDLMNDYSDVLSSVNMQDGTTYLQYLSQFIGTEVEQGALENAINWLKQTNNFR